MIYLRSLAVNQPRLQQPQPKIKEYKAASPSQLCMFQSQFLSSFQLLVLPTLVEICHFSLVLFLGFLSSKNSSKCNNSNDLLDHVNKKECCLQKKLILCSATYITINWDKFHFQIRFHYSLENQVI